MRNIKFFLPNAMQSVGVNAISIQEVKEGKKPTEAQQKFIELLKQQIIEFENAVAKQVIEINP